MARDMKDYHGAKEDLKSYDEWVKDVAKYRKEHKSYKQSVLDQIDDIKLLDSNLEATPGSQRNHYDDTVRSDLLKTDLRRAYKDLESIQNQRTKYGLYYERSKGKKKEMEKMRTRAKKTLEERVEPEGYIKGKWWYEDLSEREEESLSTSGKPCGA